MAKDDKLNIKEIKGEWDKGYSLNVHTLMSVYLGDGSFDTTYSDIGKMLNRIKYKADKGQVQPLGRIAGEVLKRMNKKGGVDVIIPIPPSNHRRIFQPVYELVKVAADIAEIPVDFECLDKNESISLKGIDAPEERVKALKESLIIKKSDLQGKNILLFDDLYRSGSTLNAATRLLRENGSGKVFVLTITRTRKKR